MLIRRKNIVLLITLVMVSFSSVSIADDVVGRPIIPSCKALIVSQEESSFSSELSEARWNKHYSDGHIAIREGDYSLAEQHMCSALAEAKYFAERDWRFAETLDELGLIYFMQDQFDMSEKAQGAAVAELLLATGPTMMRQTSTRKVLMFIERLSRVYAAQGRNDLIEKMNNTPYEIYEMGYLPLNSDLTRRLGWLVSEYLGLENINASQYLLILIANIEER